ncbi:MAG: ATP-grasp domain-containing protein [Oligoflexia bacterium]|nr:ATP-grasp domain-containing protein [Oligoflexia bacterium]
MVDLLKRESSCFPFIKLLSEEYKNIIKKTDKIIYFGNLNIYKKILNIKKISPGIFFHPKYFHVSEYSNFVSEFMLNKYRYSLAKDLVLKEAMFVRPNSNSKPFPGQIFSKEKWEKYKRQIASDEVVCWSSPKAIHSEYRFFVVETRISSWCLYQKNYSSKKIKDISLVYSFAKQVIRHFQPQKVFVLDICLTDNISPKIVEYNAFGCSVGYNCKLDIVAKDILESYKRN